MKSIPSVTSIAGLPAAVSSWRSRRAGEAHLIVCKATYRLAPGVLALAPAQDPLLVSDVFRDDEGSSLLSASDFAVMKRRADVVVIGSAFAPGGRPVRRLVAYVGVGELEKAVEIAADRQVDLQGTILDGPAFVSMPLSWERAAADESRNPVGRPATRDSFGRMSLPNLQPVAFEPSGPDWSVPPVGLGPIAPSWPVRRVSTPGMALRPAPGGTSWPEPWIDHGVPDDGDLSFFQIAPTDQQLERLRSDTQIVLENLSPQSSTLGTRLPGHRVRAFLAPSASEVELVCDTLVIDTDRECVTVTWRGSYFLANAPDVDRVVVVLETREKPTSPEEIRRLCSGNDGSAKYAGTPFAQSGTQSMSAASTPIPRTPLQSFETAELPAIGGSTLGTARIGQTVLGLSALTGLSSPPSTRTVAAPIAAQPPAAIPAAPPSQPAMVRAPLPSQPMMSGLTAPSASDLARAAKPPSYMAVHREPAAVETKAHDAKAALGGVASASNAASDRMPKQQATPQAAAPSRRASTGYFDLLWHSTALPEKLRALPEWARILQGDKKELLTDKAREGRVGEDVERIVRRALARGEVLDAGGVHRAVLEAVDEDGVLVRPIVTVEGELSLTLDPFESLAVSLSLSEGLAATDKKFKEAYDSAAELVRESRKVTLPMIEGGLTRLRQAFASTAKGYPPNYLESTAERWLVDERKFLKRKVLGSERLIATIAPTHGGALLPLFLPAELEQIVPTVVRFRARVLAEPHARQDASDGDPTSLVALAVARAVGR